MMLTKCPSASSFAQTKKNGKAMICQTKQGLILDFGDKKTMAEVERKMTPSARRAVHELLEGIQVTQARRAASLLQETARMKSKIGSSDDEDGESDRQVEGEDS